MKKILILTSDFMYPKIYLTFIFLCFTLGNLFSQPKETTSDTTSQKLAFVLSGGGAKGIAEIGALKILEEAGIRPDIITGTSIGSIFGGLYAIGYTAQDLEDLALNTDWAYYFDNDLDRLYHPLEEREDADKYQVQFPIENWKLELPTGVIKGQKISLLFSRATIPAHNIQDFDQFKIPYRAVATNFETGEAKVFSSGDLADAMQASMTIPSVFEPFELEGTWYVDGGTARNLPVKDAIDLGADKVIAIDIGAPLYKKEEVESIIEILDQTSSFRIVDSNKEQALKADFIIRPQVDGVSALDFEQNDTLLRRGEIAARRSLSAIKQVIKNRASTPLDRIQIPDTIRVVAFEIRGCNELQRKTFSNLLQIKTGKTYRLESIEDRIKKLFGSQLVKNANYRILPEEDGHRLIINTQPQTGEYLKISANYDSDLKAGFLLNATLRNRLLNGSKLSLDLKISENPSLIADYLVYTSRRPNIGWHFHNLMHFYPGALYEDGEKRQRFRMRHFDTKMHLFSGLNNRFLIAAGIGIERYSRSEEIFDPEEDNLRFDQPYLQLKFKRDTYDRSHFPTDGSHFSFEGKYGFARELQRIESDTIAEINDKNLFMRMQYNKVFNWWERFVPIFYMDAGMTPNVENNFLNRFFLGRQAANELTHVEFFGLRYMELQATRYAFGGLKLRMEPAEDIFASVVYNYGYYKNENFEVVDGIPTDKVLTREGAIMGTGFELGWLTSIGPVIFTAEYNVLENRTNFSLHLGHIF